MRFGDGVKSHEWIQEWLARRIQDYQRRGWGPFAVVEKSSGNLIGYCGLFYFPDINGQPEIEIGYRLAREAWGQGYATEAVLAVRDLAFDSLGLTRLIAMVDPDNAASIRVAEKAGMTYEQDVVFQGYTHPDRVYSVGRDR
jgi:RimJ/RimL family protein N-acetyltransferase